MTKCLQCSKEFVPSNPSRESKYCSRACYYASCVGHPPTNPLRRQVNICETCGKEFEAGGRSGKKRETRYCSHVCRARGQTTWPLPNTLTPVEAAYLAGFLDGEGSIIRVKPRAWRITIFQNHEPVVRWIAERTGTGRVGTRIPTAHNLVKKPAVLGEQWYWNLYGYNAALLLRQLLPYMIVKRKRALEMLADFPEETEPG